MSDEGHNYTFSFTSNEYADGYDRIFRGVEKRLDKSDPLYEHSVQLAEALQVEGGSIHILPVDNSMMDADAPRLEPGYVLLVKVEKVRMNETSHPFITVAGAVA